MENLARLSDDQIDSNLGELIDREREILTEVLHHLREADRRRLFSRYGYTSLFDYAVKRFKYSEDQAYRRIAAMRLLKELPQIEEKIGSGELSLSNITQAVKFFRAEKKENRAKTSAEKLDLLGMLENCSAREAQKVIERVSPVKKDDFEVLPLKVSDQLKEKLERLKAAKSHSHPHLELHELVEMMADLAIEKWDRMAKAERATQKPRRSENAASKRGGAPMARDRFIPSALRHQVYMRDGGRCTQCGGRWHLQCDHIKPYARGGEHALENLRLLCGPCNQRYAIEVYGPRKMDSHLRENHIRYA